MGGPVLLLYTRKTKKFGTTDLVKGALKEGCLLCQLIQHTSHLLPPSDIRWNAEWREVEFIPQVN